MLRFEDLTSDQLTSLKQKCLFEKRGGEPIAWSELANPPVTNKEAKEFFNQYSWGDEDL